MHHELKIFDLHFEHIASGRKKAEVRFNDRDYRVGDTITFYAGFYKDGKFIYQCKKISAEISHIDNFGVQEGYVSLSLDKVGMLIVGAR